MKLKTIVITGASDGIGKAAAKILKEKGHNVVIVGRSKLKTKQVAQELGVKYYTADFSVLSDVRKLASDLNNDLKKIDVLVNNAGAVMSNRELTVDGNEKTLQVNHLSAFLLTNLLINKLVSCKATVINTSSVANRLLSNFDIEDLNLNEGYSPTRAYGNAKLANILFTKELNKRYGNNGIRTAAFHPGNVASNFSTDSSSLFMKIVYKSPLKRFLISPIRG
ncbi:MAG: hypothetical protein QG623_221, partial [Patescibacteria group bacterium]|nr:hypothetical protein [Patescibacteria group bacterium]